MRTQSTPYRLAAGLASFALFASPVLQARAQAPAPPANEATTTDTMTPVVDPPSRVGRLAQTTGTVSFHTADETQWQPATLNYPITSGNSLWTEPESRAEVEVGPAHVVMDQGTEFDIDTLGDHEMVATAAQGRVFLSLPQVEAGDSYQVRTPRGVVTIGQSGRYEVAAGDTDHPTTVTVVEGLAQVSGDNVSLAVGPNQTGQISGTDHFEGTVEPAADSPFLTAELQALPPPMPVQGAPGAPAGRPAPPAIVAQMTGGDALVQNGAWVPTPEYGNVWYPPVDVGWVPYRHGHWGYVAPWGWTWIDEAPWGFAPFHYGRWVEIGPRWGWMPSVPGVAIGYGGYGYGGPVYSPALVSFIGLGAGLAVGAAIGASVGWIPLGPREVYHPWYHASPNYVRNVNVTNVTNVNNITNNSTNVNNFVNRRSVTVVPGSAMSGSQPIAGRVQPVSAQALASARPLSQVPVTPTSNTVGVTPTVARQFNLPANTNAAVAPGPSLAGRPGLATTPAGLAAPGGLHATTPSAEGVVPGAGGHPGLGAAAVVGGAAVLGGAAALSRPSGVGGAPGPAIGGAPGPAIGGRPAGITGAAANSTLPTLHPTAPLGAGATATPGAPGSASPGLARPPLGTTTPGMVPGTALSNTVRPNPALPNAALSNTTLPNGGRPNTTLPNAGQPNTANAGLSNSVHPNTTLPATGQPNAALSNGGYKPPSGINPGAQTVHPPVTSATLGNVRPNATVPNTATAPAVQHYTPPPQQYKPPVQQYKAPPVVHNTPPPPVVHNATVAPQVHAVAPPPPVVHNPAPPPPPKKVCPPGKPSC